MGKMETFFLLFAILGGPICWLFDDSEIKALILGLQICSLISYITIKGMTNA